MEGLTVWFNIKIGKTLRKNCSPADTTKWHLIAISTKPSAELPHEAMRKEAQPDIGWHLMTLSGLSQIATALGLLYAPNSPLSPIHMEHIDSSTPIVIT